MFCIPRVLLRRGREAIPVWVFLALSWYLLVQGPYLLMLRTALSPREEEGHSFRCTDAGGEVGEVKGITEGFVT